MFEGGITPVVFLINLTKRAVSRGREMVRKRYCLV